MKNNYEIMVEQSAQLFLDYDQNDMIKKFHLESDNQYLYVIFFGARYQIDRSTGGVTRFDGATAGFNEVLSIYDVLCCSKEGAHASGTWITLTSLHAQSNFGASDSTMNSKFEKDLEGRVDELKCACESLGGTPATKADVGYEFEAFPFLPILFQFWDKDEDFDGKVTFLFDSNTLDFMHFETAWYVAGYLTDQIKKKLNITE